MKWKLSLLFLLLRSWIPSEYSREQSPDWQGYVKNTRGPADADAIAAISIQLNLNRIKWSIAIFSFSFLSRQELSFPILFLPSIIEWLTESKTGKYLFVSLSRHFCYILRRDKYKPILDFWLLIRVTLRLPVSAALNVRYLRQKSY